MAVPTAAPRLSAEKQVEMLRQMLTIRRFDSRVLELPRRRHARHHPPVHRRGGGRRRRLRALRQDDYITSTHRGHGHCIAKGGDIEPDDGRAAGQGHRLLPAARAARMHIADVDKGMLGANGIVGGGMGIATGAGARRPSCAATDAVAVCFFGDGALNQGILHESMNLAAIWKLPVVFVCENNQYAMSARVRAMTAGRRSVASAPRPTAFPGVDVDGMDVLAVYEAASEAVERAPARRGPELHRVHDLPLPRPPRRRSAELPDQGRGRSLAREGPDRALQRRPARRAGVTDEDADGSSTSRSRREVDDGHRRSPSSPEPDAVDLDDGHLR